MTPTVGGSWDTGIGVQPTCSRGQGLHIPFYGESFQLICVTVRHSRTLRPLLLLLLLLPGTCVADRLSATRSARLHYPGLLQGIPSEVALVASLLTGSMRLRAASCTICEGLKRPGADIVDG